MSLIAMMVDGACAEAAVREAGYPIPKDAAMPWIFEGYSIDETAEALLSSTPYFSVSNTPDGHRDGPGIENDPNEFRPWTKREDLDFDSGHPEEVANYLEDDGEEADWFIHWPDGRIERVAYFGESLGFIKG